ncbi:MAG TPA: DUF6114 domain-containing protein [archaeon]|nr:DUF6114 domain-containing protein [archaeon]
MERTEKPTAAFILSLIGGIIILLVGFVVMVVGAIVSFFIGGLGGIFGLLGVAWCILMIICAFMLNSQPEQHVIWGVLILVLSLLSWVGAFGGLFIGFLLGLIGGILGISWKPSATAKIPQATTPTMRICQQCGRSVDTNVRFCPYCGKELP